MAPVSQNTEENNVIRIASSSRADYSQGPIQSGEGTVYTPSSPNLLH